MKFAFIERQRFHHHITTLCRVLEAAKAVIEASVNAATQQILLDTGGGNEPSTAANNTTLT